jgi:hypothetical protein
MILGITPDVRLKAAGWQVCASLSDVPPGEQEFETFAKSGRLNALGRPINKNKN